MIKKLYIDNFRCFVNFELQLDEMALILGGNGSGKSTVLSVLYKLQELVVRGKRIEEVFSARDLSMTHSRDTQVFAVDLAVADGDYRYELTIEHDRDRDKMRIQRERLRIDGNPLFSFHTGKAQLYRDDHTEGPSYPFDWARSGVASLYESADNRRLSRFKRELANLIIVKPCPPLFDSETKAEDEFLEPTMRNFVGWYRYAAQENMGALAKLFADLKDILPGFESISLSKSGTSRFALKALFDGSDSANKHVKYGFDQLSDGQRALVALYSLLILPGERRVSLFIDEPDAYLSLGEVQPWISQVFDACGESLEQAVLVSHHPITIDYLAGTCAKWFSRDADGPVRVSDESGFSDQALPISQLIAREQT